jgi:hypothetical protein
MKGFIDDGREIIHPVPDGRHGDAPVFQPGRIRADSRPRPFGGLGVRPDDARFIGT